MIRKYGFALCHLVLWTLTEILIFYQTRLALLVGLFALMVTAASLAANAIERRATTCLLLLAAPLLVLLVTLPLNQSAALDWVEFHTARPALEERVRRLPTPAHQLRLIGFHMDDRGWLPTGPTIFETLVYDESDEMGKPIGQWSQMWRVRASGLPHFHSILQPVSPTHSVAVRRMGDHWYWVEQVLK